MLLMALIPTSEVSGKISTDLGKTGGGPYSRAVVREMLGPCLDPACKPRAGRANGKANAQESPERVCHHCLPAVPVTHRKGCCSAVGSPAREVALLRGGIIKALILLQVVLSAGSRGSPGEWGGLALGACCNLLFLKNQHAFFAKLKHCKNIKA